MIFFADLTSNKTTYTWTFSQLNNLERNTLKTVEMIVDFRRTLSPSGEIWPQKTKRVVRTAEQIIGTTLPNLQELYSSRVSKRTDKITLDPSHPAHSLFELLPSGRRYRALSTRTTRHRNSFFLKHSISWTLDIKRGTHNTVIHYLFITHTYFSVQILHISYIIVYIIYFVFAILYIAYLSIILLLSVSCPVAASVTMTNSLHV